MPSRTDRRKGMPAKTTPRQQYINIGSSSAFRIFTDVFYSFISNCIANGYKSIVFVCIGTDRSTGDSLGPLIGHKISNLKQRNVYVYGNLEQPVHARNLEDITRQISQKYQRPFVIAIDACLGRMEHVGYLTIGGGPIKPGSGVNKNLAPVGDMHITGIVNFGGFMDFLVLQNTRLSVVMKMADLVSMGIRYVMWKAENDPEASVIFLN
jgi:putative sporulation protein YyaC